MVCFHPGIIYPTPPLPHITEAGGERNDDDEDDDDDDDDENCCYYYYIIINSNNPMSLHINNKYKYNQIRIVLFSVLMIAGTMVT